MKQSLEHQRKELNDCRAEITALKMHIEVSNLGGNLLASNIDHAQFQPLEKYKEDINSLQKELESLKAKNRNSPGSISPINSENESAQTEEKVVEILEDKSIISHPVEAASEVVDNSVYQQATQTCDDNTDESENVSQELSINSTNDISIFENVGKPNGDSRSEESRPLLKSELSGEADPEKRASSFYSSFRSLYSLPHRALPEVFSLAWALLGFLLCQPCGTF